MFLSQHWVANKLRITPQTKVLDIGGAAARFEFGDITVVDIVRPDWDCKFVSSDICRRPLPFQDNDFEVVICTQTLEDLYNPFLVMEEMQRVGQRGYIETPSRGLEMSFAVSPHQGPYPGWGHHRWMFETVAPNKMRVIAKMWHLLRHDAEKVLHWAGPTAFEFFWSDSFEFEELQLVDAAGDHWDSLVQEHNEFVARHRHLIVTSHDLQQGQQGRQSPVLEPRPQARAHQPQVSPR